MTDTPISGVDVSTFTIPTETPESDGTLAWDSTTIIVVEVQAGGDRLVSVPIKSRAACPGAL